MLPLCADEVGPDPAVQHRESALPDRYPVPVAELLRPTTQVRESFVAAMAEFRAEGRGAPEDRTMIGVEIRDHGSTWHTPEGFARYVTSLRAEADEDTPRPAGIVAATTLWWIDGADYLGRLAIRHRLTPRLLEGGGHIGFDVRPTARRRGHATTMLRTALPIAADLGIDRALITCDVDNVASRKVIEACGGEFEDQRGGKFRFWVATSPASAT
jgi:predicted acetyltransferase